MVVFELAHAHPSSCKLNIASVKTGQCKCHLACRDFYAQPALCVENQRLQFQS